MVFWKIIDRKQVGVIFDLLYRKKNSRLGFIKQKIVNKMSEWGACNLKIISITKSNNENGSSQGRAEGEREGKMMNKTKSYIPVRYVRVCVCVMCGLCMREKERWQSSDKALMNFSYNFIFVRCRERWMFRVLCII